MCHHDSSGKFNPLTYFIIHYDVTKYWVDNKSAWEKFKQDVNNKLKVDDTQGSSTKFKNGDYTGKKAKVTANVLNVRYNKRTRYNVI